MRGYLEGCEFTRIDLRLELRRRPTVQSECCQKQVEAVEMGFLRRASRVNRIRNEGIERRSYEVCSTADRSMHDIQQNEMSKRILLYVPLTRRTRVITRIKGITDITKARVSGERRGLHSVVYLKKKVTFLTY